MVLAGGYPTKSSRPAVRGRGEMSLGPRRVLRELIWGGGVRWDGGSPCKVVDGGELRRKGNSAGGVDELSPVAAHDM
jgi:hypothetical protein